MPPTKPTNHEDHMPETNTLRNKSRRQAAHAKRYPKKDTRSAEQRRNISKAWLEEAQRRAKRA